MVCLYACLNRSRPRLFLPLAPVRLLAHRARHAPGMHGQPLTPREIEEVLDQASLVRGEQPCGAPSYSINVLPAMPLAAARLDASIGTVLSSVP